MTKIKKIISGGQSGADIAGVIVAKKLGIPTGGWMPNGFLTEYGERPEYRDEYGMIQTITKGMEGYIERTRLNVIEGDVTIIFSFSSMEVGSTLTKKFCLEENKPFLWIGVQDTETTVTTVIDFINKNNPEIINIAGNRDSLWPGIESFVVDCLTKALTEK